MKSRITLLLTFTLMVISTFTAPAAPPTASQAGFYRGKATITYYYPNDKKTIKQQAEIVAILRSNSLVTLQFPAPPGSTQPFTTNISAFYDPWSTYISNPYSTVQTIAASGIFNQARTTNMLSLDGIFSSHYHSYVSFSFSAKKLTRIGNETLDTTEE